MKQSVPKRTLNRRKFLSILAVSAAAGLVYRSWISPQKKLFTLRHSRPMMGTVVNFTLIGPDQKSCHTALNASISKMEHLETIISRHNPDSSLSQLNREGRLDNADQDLIQVIQLAIAMSNRTGGAFDMTVLPLLGLYQEQKKTGNAPDPSTLIKAREHVDYRQVVVEGSSIKFNKTGMGITLDGIGKGYIVDEGVKSLRNQGFENIYLEAGGDLMVSGSKGNDKPWVIAIENPRPEKKNDTITLKIRNKAVATSGDYRQAYTPDKQIHHIINPLTGISPAELSSCTITAPTVAEADGLATASMVLGPTKSLDLLESLPECGGFLVGKDLVTHTTTGFFS